MNAVAFTPAHDAVAFLRQALEARSASDDWLTVAVPAPVGWSPSAALRPTSVFLPPSGAAFVGFGVACSIERGDHDLGAVRAAMRAHDAQSEVVVHPVLGSAGRYVPVWIGGTSFAVDPTVDALWTAFPHAAFARPRWLLQRAADGWSAGFTVHARTLTAAVVQAAVDEYGTLVGAPGGAPVTVARAGAAVVDADAAWVDRVAVVLEAIRRGTVEKVVLVRHVDLPPTPSGTGQIALERLAARYPTCTRFLVAAGDAEFFGASPETLVRLDGFQVSTEAVAGSASANAAAQLTDSDKDRREHQFVVDAIVGALTPLCAEVTYPPTPVLRRLSNVVHLTTPITGVLATPQHVLELVARLHPTPAVAGTPTPAALALLRAIEPVGRGWFAGPFGWCDAAGNGHFVVTLRSCVRSPRGGRIYAGSGIVRGSDPRAELDEMRLKMRAMHEALDGTADQPTS